MLKNWGNQNLTVSNIIGNLSYNPTYVFVVIWESWK